MTTPPLRRPGQSLLVREMVGDELSQRSVHRHPHIGQLAESAKSRLSVPVSYDPLAALVSLLLLPGPRLQQCQTCPSQLPSLSNPKASLSVSMTNVSSFQTPNLAHACQDFSLSHHLLFSNEDHPRTPLFQPLLMTVTPTLLLFLPDPRKLRFISTYNFHTHSPVSLGFKTFKKIQPQRE
jgi:hypothetical protein